MFSVENGSRSKFFVAVQLFSFSMLFYFSPKLTLKSRTTGGVSFRNPKHGKGDMATVANLANQPARSRQVETSPFAQRKAEPGRIRPPHATGYLGANPANSCPLTPLGFLERAATVFGHCPSVVYHDTVFTWSQTHRRCLRLASALASLGISRGDIVSHRPFSSVNSSRSSARICYSASLAKN